MKIGVISDTHNYLDPRVHELFHGVDYILHGGDVGLPAIVHELEKIAPVTVVLGNTDDSAFGYRLTETIILSGTTFLIQHIVHPDSLVDDLQARIDRVRPDVVIYGHTHRALETMRNGVLFLNPGYAGRPKFDSARSVAILELGGPRISTRFLPL